MTILTTPTKAQSNLFEFVFGALVYVVVLGFFEEYTSILSTWSYSVTFMTGFVLQVLTMLTFGLKKKVVSFFKDRPGRKYVLMMGFFLWLILFVSKFVFLFVIESIFGQRVELSGFVGLLLIMVVMAGVKTLMERLYMRLG